MKMRYLINAAAVAAMSAFLAACGGGGSATGGNGPGVPNNPQPDGRFVGFSSLPETGSTTISGTASSASATLDGEGVSAVSAFAQSDTDLTLDRENGDFRGVTLKTESGTVTWNGENSEIGEGNGFITAERDAGDLKLADPDSNGFEYQTFGTWAAGTDSPEFGAFSVGAATAAADVPGSGSGTFKGKSAGYYVDAGGNLHRTESDATLDVDFAGRSVAFSTSGTTADGSSAGNLDLSGSLTYSNGGFSGAVESAGGLTGKTSGNFYGEGAKEAGGTFDLKGAGIESYVGGYGAKR